MGKGKGAADGRNRTNIEHRMGKGKGAADGRNRTNIEHRTPTIEHRMGKGKGAADGRNRTNTEWGRGSCWRRFDLGTKYSRFVVSQNLVQKTRSWLVVVGSGRVGQEAARRSRAADACTGRLPTQTQVRDAGAGMLRLRGRAPEPAIAQLLVSPARNSGETQCNILRRKLMQAAFHSMFDVGRSMFDVRFPLVAASGRPMLSVVHLPTGHPYRNGSLVPGAGVMRAFHSLSSRSWSRMVSAKRACSARFLVSQGSSFMSKSWTTGSSL
jgi:hypothetical protein